MSIYSVNSNNHKNSDFDSSLRTSSFTSKNECQITLKQNSVKESALKFGDISITNGSDIHFGNKTFYQGPVTIKQYVCTDRDVKFKPIGEDSSILGAIANSDLRKLPSANDDSTCGESVILNQHGKEEKADTLSSDTKNKFLLNRIRLSNVSLWSKLLVATVSVLIGLRFVILKSRPASIEYSSESLSKQEKQEKDVDTSIGILVRIAYQEYSIYVPLICGLIAIIILIVKSKYVFVEDSSVSFTKPAIATEVQEEDLGTPIEASVDPWTSLSPTKVRLVQRLEWLAQPPSFPADPLETPVPYVIIAHTATESCESQAQCVFQVRFIQTFHMESRGWWDIGYNFLIGGDGQVYVGRGWDKLGAHTYGYNKVSIGIAFIGTFINQKPPSHQLIACRKLMDLGVEMGFIKKDYKLFGARQLRPTKSPGEALYEEIKTWSHWANEV